MGIMGGTDDGYVEQRKDGFGGRNDGGLRSVYDRNRLRNSVYLEKNESGYMSEV